MSQKILISNIRNPRKFKIRDTYWTGHVFYYIVFILRYYWFEIFLFFCLIFRFFTGCCFFHKCLTSTFVHSIDVFLFQYIRSLYLDFYAADLCDWYFSLSVSKLTDSYFWWLGFMLGVVGHKRTLNSHIVDWTNTLKVIQLVEGNLRPSIQDTRQRLLFNVYKWICRHVSHFVRPNVLSLQRIPRGSIRAQSLDCISNRFALKLSPRRFVTTRRESCSLTWV